MCRIVSWYKELKINLNVLDHNKQRTKKETTKFYFNNTHIITTSIRRLYLYKFYICDWFKSRYKTLISRNKNIEFKKKVISKWLWHNTFKIEAFNI